MLDPLIVAYLPTISNNVDRNTEIAKSGNIVFVWQDYHSAIGMNHTKQYRCESLTFLLHWKQINTLH